MEPFVEEKSFSPYFLKNDTSKTLEVKIPIKTAEIRIPLNYKEICRACLLENNNMFSLSATENIEGQRRTILEILMSISNIQIFENDGLPNVICFDCLQSALFVSGFKQQCETAEAVLKKYFSMFADEKITLDHKEDNKQLEFSFSDVEDDVPLPYCNNGLHIDEIEPKQDCIVIADLEINLTEDDKNKFTIISEEKVESAVNSVSIAGVECTICNKSVRNMKLHMKRHTGRHFTCELCGKSYTTKYDLNNHLKTHSKERPFKCKVCLKGFCHIYRLKEHMLSHDNKREFVCELCGKGFNVSKRLTVHMRVHSGIKPHKCTVCHKAYASSEKLKIHIRSHTGEKKFVCDFCGKGFLSKEMLKTHIRIHTGDRPYSCNVVGCDRRFTTQHGLLMHKPVHSDERPYPCLTCGKRFARASDWRKHEAIHASAEEKVDCPQQDCVRSFSNHLKLKEHLLSHSQDKRALCTLCGKSFARKSDLTRHARTHSQERPFKCLQCGVGFNQQFGLTQHLRKHSGESHFICDLCGKGFNRKCSLQKHKMVHFGIKNYKCDQCDMKFTDSSQLLRHTRIHTGERPYKCELCPKAFSARSSYVVHLRAHSGERPYQCPFCNKACATSTALKIHMRYHTGERPYQCPECGFSFARSDLRSIHMKVCCPDAVAEPVIQTPLKFYMNQKNDSANYFQEIPHTEDQHQLTESNFASLEVDLEGNMLTTQNESSMMPELSTLNQIIGHIQCNEGMSME